MKNTFLIFSILLLPLLVSVTSCDGSDGSEEIGCDEEMLDFFDMEPSDGIDLGCEMHLVKRIQGNIISSTAQYYVSNHCLDMIITPFGCNQEEISDPWLLGVEFTEEIIGVRP